MKGNQVLSVVYNIGKAYRTISTVKKDEISKVIVGKAVFEIHWKQRLLRPMNEDAKVFAGILLAKNESV